MMCQGDERQESWSGLAKLQRAVRRANLCDVKVEEKNRRLMHVSVEEEVDVDIREIEPFSPVRRAGCLGEAPSQAVSSSCYFYMDPEVSRGDRPNVA